MEGAFPFQKSSKKTGRRVAQTLTHILEEFGAKFLGPKAHVWKAEDPKVQASFHFELVSRCFCLPGMDRT